MGKAPAFMFYVKDWISYPDLKICSHSTKGIWADFICHMWFANPKGKLTATRGELQRMVGATNSDFDYFLAEAWRHGFCDIGVDSNENVTDHNGNERQEITLINRRIYKEFMQKENNRLRQKRYRNKQGCHVKGDGNVANPFPYPFPNRTSDPANSYEKPDQKTVDSPAEFSLSKSMKDFLINEGFKGNIQAFQTKFVLACKFNSNDVAEKFCKFVLHMKDTDDGSSFISTTASKHWETAVGDLFAKIKDIRDRLESKGVKKVDLFIQSKIKIKGHPRAILGCLMGLIECIDNKIPIANHWGFMETKFAIENDKCNANDRLEIHKKLKQSQADGTLKFFTKGLFESI